MRNKVIHDYFEVGIGLVWVAVKSDLPKLMTQIKTILAPACDGNNADLVEVISKNTPPSPARRPE